MEGRSWSERRFRDTPAQTPAAPSQIGSALLGQTLKVRRVNDGNAFFIGKILAFDQGFVRIEVQPGQYSTTTGLSGGERLWIPISQIREFAEIPETPPAPAPPPAAGSVPPAKELEEAVPAE